VRQQGRAACCVCVCVRVCVCVCVCARLRAWVCCSMRTPAARLLGRVLGVCRSVMWHELWCARRAGGCCQPPPCCAWPAQAREGASWWERSARAVAARANSRAAPRAAVVQPSRVVWAVGQHPQTHPHRHMHAWWCGLCASHTRARCCCHSSAEGGAVWCMRAALHAWRHRVVRHDLWAARQHVWRCARACVCVCEGLCACVAAKEPGAVAWRRRRRAAAGGGGGREHGRGVGMCEQRSSSTRAARCVAGSSPHAPAGLHASRRQQWRCGEAGRVCAGAAGAADCATVPAGRSVAPCVCVGGGGCMCGRWPAAPAPSGARTVDAPARVMHAAALRPSGDNQPG
jgi:hypothetical protein